MDNVKSGNGSTAVGVTAAALAAAGVACLLLHRSLWIDRAGDPVALDANEGVATLAWLLGWSLVLCAGATAVVLLCLVVIQIVVRGRSLGGGIALVVTTVLIVAAGFLAPVWGTGSV
ncbi:hypothetical protein ABC304_16250 [Microbacterium sp. 1P10UB]|uniref:hypothetical protein n=1 Tax=unclassified Microbacterium TaxID=2609290 RepID=UPI00399FE1EF